MPSTSVPPKHTWKEVNEGTHPTWRSVFTLEQKEYIVNNLMDPDRLVALGGSGPKDNGTRLSLDSYESLAKEFNEKFKTTFKTTQIRNMLRYLRTQGKRHHSSTTAFSDTGDDVDDGEDSVYSEYGGGNDHGDDGDIQATSSTREPIILEDSDEETLGRSTEKGKSTPMAYRTQSDDTDLLSMLKDLRHTSMLQCEAEMEQTRREQLRQQDIVQLEQLWVEEARLRMEESRVREEETTKRVQLRFEEAKMREEESTKLEQLREEESTKRESIRMELEKTREQVKMKELEIAHTNRLLLLEETRYKRALAEKENMML
ncbi:MAG: hypothetical protein J3Q66DRAFT_404585 [Benniella sp.]|nr:MAG: hypothetical protein J3Q66DRAFT_404585 [Benniella sp.]